MKRLFRFTLVCSILITVLCGSVIAIASATASAEASLIPNFVTCGQTPCYLGITPDQTLYRDAASIIAKAQVEAVENSPDSYYLPRFNTYLHIVDTAGVVDEIDISLYQPRRLLAGEVIRRYGPPCYAASLGTTLAVKYPYFAVFFAMEESGDSWILKPSSRVIEIRLLGGVSKGCLSVDNRTIFRWRGFGSY